MSAGLSIAGGIYRETCISPDWNQIYGSGGRAAIALHGHVDHVKLYTYASPDILKVFQAMSAPYGVGVVSHPSEEEIVFSYTHCLSRPHIWPPESAIRRHPPINVEDDVVLRFGMMEGTAKVKAKKCIYDPQSASNPEVFLANGSQAESLAVVANSAEIRKLTEDSDPFSGAKRIMNDWGAEVVIVKAGMDGAYIVGKGGTRERVPPYLTDTVWTIGSGDIFSAMFSYAWGVQNKSTVEAADIASKAVASYVNSMSLPVPDISALQSRYTTPVEYKKKKVYLAGPFFDFGQKLLIEEARNALHQLRMDVFSPFHDVGEGPAELVVPQDIQALKDCEVVVAILDGNDTGTLFEVGYTRALNKPVYALANVVSSGDLKMVEGSGCKIYQDLPTLVYHLAWGK